MDLTKLNKKIPLKVHFSALKLYNFNFIAFHVSCNVQMHTSCHKKAKLKIIKNALPTTVDWLEKLYLNYKQIILGLKAPQPGLNHSLQVCPSVYE